MTLRRYFSSFFFSVTHFLNLHSTLAGLALLVTLVPVGPAFAGGDLVNNGGGMAEKTILFTMEKLESYLKSCLSSDSCRLDSQQKAVLTLIYQGLPQEKQNPNLIQFLSESKNPGFFILEGEAKVAKTGSVPGSPIFINIDMIYNRDPWGNPAPITLPEAIAILVHELGHHYGSESHEFLDLLGVRVGSFHSLQSYTTAPLPYLKNFGMTAINLPEKTGAFPELLLQLNHTVVNMSDSLREASHCFFRPYPNYMDLEVYKPLGSFIYNLHWSSARHGTDSAELVMTATVSHWCLPPVPRDAKPGPQEHEIMIRIRVKNINSADPVYKVKRLTLEQKISNEWR